MMARVRARVRADLTLTLTKSHPDLEFVPDPGGVERLEGGALPLPSWLPLLISFMMSAAEAAPPPWLGVGVRVEVGVGL